MVEAVKLSRSVTVESKEEYAKELHLALDEFLNEGRGAIILGFQSTEPMIRIAAVEPPEQQAAILRVAAGLMQTAHDLNLVPTEVSDEPETED